jgi:succinylglutamate desuccinylase
MAPQPGLDEARLGARVGDRVLGRLHGRRGGPTLLCVAGVHGNEPAGVHAVHRVLGKLGNRVDDLSGDLVALAGNLSALAVGRRFVDRDLNRAWTDARLELLRSDDKLNGVVEDREQLELLEEIESVVATTRGPVYALDLHTTSGPGGIFSAFTDSLPHRDFATHFPVPMIFGLEEQVDGTLLNLLSEHGLIAVTIETGQHDEPAAVERAEAAIWIAVVTAGLLPERVVPEVIGARKLLERVTRHLPRALEMRYRREVRNGDGFRMAPGYSNFDEVAVGQVVAHDRDGDIVVGEDSRLLMPLYQEQGEDGFFLVREFSPFWMRVSELLRRLDVARFVHWLPGVRRAEGGDDAVVVNKQVARYFAKQFFHLLGYRRIDENGELVMRRRRFDEAKYLARLPSPDPSLSGD